MIRTTSEFPDYKTQFTNGKDIAFADTTADKGGSEAGFRPHELLEAALACCINISLRRCARENSIALRSVTTTVDLDRSRPDESCFEYSVELSGNLSDAERKLLLDKTGFCAVRQTLCGNVTFKPAEGLR